MLTGRPNKKPLKANILSVAEYVPSNILTQDQAKELSYNYFEDKIKNLERYMRVFDNSKVEKRYLSNPIEWYLKDKSWPERNKAYLKFSIESLNNIVEQMLSKANLSAHNIDHIITVSSTGIATPTIESHLMDRFSFKQDLKRTPIFGLGCVGGLSGLQRASEIANAYPGEKVMLLTVEACSLGFQPHEYEPKNIVAMSIFSDGAAGAIVSTEPATQFNISNHYEYRWPNSINVMGWNIKDNGLSVVLSREIPSITKNKLPKVYNNYLELYNMHNTNFNSLVAHPGGAKVLEALATGLNVKVNKLKQSWTVLNSFGNMSSPTILFVLNRCLKESKSGEKHIMIALGPGFTSALSLLEVE
ncbi:MAG: hypothetical protein MK008_10435 [Bdellovibrionales bacterium]|nr:hypothetical protein [Bdellovibrionales bacterium]